MKRMFFVDWLRILAIATVFIFHTSHFFDPIYWHVKNPEQSQLVLVFLGFVNTWIMPLFFFLSGAAGYFSMDKPFKGFISGKALRLLVPLVFGIVFLIPPQKYVEALSNNRFSGSFFEFLKSYFGGVMFNYKIGFNVAWLGVISYHLWFLGHLFIISAVFYPLLRMLKNKIVILSNTVSRYTSFAGGALLMFIPVAIVRVLLKIHFPEYTGWADLATYSIYFLYGYYYLSQENLRKTLPASFWISLLTGSVLYVFYMISFFFKGTFLYDLFQNNKVYYCYVFQETAGVIATWSWIIVIISAGMKYLDFDSKFRRPLNEAVLPFYILHQTVLLLVGYVVVHWHWNAWGKFGFIMVTSLFIIMVVYNFAIRPFNFMRFLFGMAPAYKTVQTDNKITAVAE
jgi:glucans biosynthesis protein C